MRLNNISTEQPLRVNYCLITDIHRAEGLLFSGIYALWAVGERLEATWWIDSRRDGEITEFQLNPIGIILRGFSLFLIRM